MARDASGRGRNRQPREKRRFAQQEGACSPRFLRREDIVLQRGKIEDGRHRNALDDPNIFTGVITQPGNF